MLSIQFNYTEQEFIDYQLYIASKSPSQQKRMFRNRWLVSLIYLGIAAVGFFNNNTSQIYIFIGLAILWYVIYPYWAKRFHKKYFTQFILQQNKDRIGNSVTVNLNDDNIQIQENGQEIELPIQQIVEIAELQKIILLRLNTDQVIILHKETNIPTEILIDYLKNLSLKRAIPYVNALNWKW